MENIHDTPKQILADEKDKFKVSEAPLNDNTTSGNSKSAQNLGNGRWKFQGKTYKEQSIGKREF